MSVTWTLHVEPEVSLWLGKPVLLVEASRCDLCGLPSTSIKTVRYDSEQDVSACAECCGDE